MANRKKKQQPKRFKFVAGALLVGAIAGASLLLPSSETIRKDTTSLTSHKDQANSYKDPNFGRLRSLFNERLNFEESKKRIEKITDMKIKDYNFTLPDPKKLTNAKKFYFVFAIPMRLPDNLADIFGRSAIPSTSLRAFETFNRGIEGDVIRALACYILTKYRVETPEQAVVAISSYVNANLELNTDTIPEHGNVYAIAKTITGSGYQKTNTHNDSNSALSVGEGICVDYTSVSADLLNSLGIPSRSLHLLASGIVTPNTDTPGLDDFIKGIAHTLLEVNLPTGTLYYEVTPPLTGDPAPIEIINTPSLYALRIAETTYPGINVFRIGSFGELTLDAFTDPNLKKLIDLDIITFGDKIRISPDLGVSVSKTLIDMDGYNVFFNDVILIQ